MQALRRSIVDAGNVIPTVDLKSRRAIAEHRSPELFVSLNPIVRAPGPPSHPAGTKLSTARLDTTAASSPGTSGRTPAADRHAPRHLQRDRIAQVDVVVDAVEADRVAVSPRRPCRPVRKRADYPIPRRIGRSGPECLIERIAGRKTLRLSCCPGAGARNRRASMKTPLSRFLRRRTSTFQDTEKTA